MKTSSAKGKARLLQQWVAEQIRALFPELTEDDVRSTGMGQPGADVQLSSRAKTLFNYSIECKRREQYKAVYDAYEQAQSHGSGTPIVVLRSNRKPALVILSADSFFELVKSAAR